MQTRFLSVFIVLILWSGLVVYARQDTLTIVAFGNSTTAPRRGVKKVYAVRLNEALTNLEISNKVINSGVGSSHTGSIKDNDFAKVKHGMDRFDTAVLAYNADWVIINFGLNDAYQDDGINGKSRIPLKKYRKNILYFIKKIEKQGGKVILLTPNPLGSRYERFRYEQVKKYADCIRQIARKKNIELVDSWRLFYKYAAYNGLGNNIDSLFTDGIHPNDTGHTLIADAIAEIIFFDEHPEL